MTLEQVPLALGRAVPAYETFIEHWKTVSTSAANPQFGSILKEGLWHADRYHQMMRENDTYLLAMCLRVERLTQNKVVHPAIRFWWVKRKWSDSISSAKATILDTSSAKRFRCHSYLPSYLAHCRHCSTA
ncbi:hypothetical protein JVT61DRAFT_9128 [Boletus reticuloceps]|uniref:Uncharacterized protein n=1 Tax=Boletus reticuloceps TaxID=495285 RepID=A0A8I2YI49_9AGAM|nr:hypothetical protein JVT61DRAFT_9128 [Boletus reticuloceps]